MLVLHLTRYYFIDVTGKKKAIHNLLDDIRDNIDCLDDPNILERVLALLTQASVGIKAAVPAPVDSLKEFEKKDYFAPTQKNETQLRFKKTSGNPGRKRKYVPMRYI